MDKEVRQANYKGTFMTPQGMAVLEDLKRFSGFDKTSFSLEPLTMAKNEGLKEMVRYINKQLEAK